MTRFSVFPAILGCFFISTSAQFRSSLYRNGRFNITLNELQEQCNYNGGSQMFENILRNLKSFRDFRTNLLDQLNAITQGSPAEGDYRSVTVINQICETNPEMINGIRQLIETVQICLNEESRLSEEEVQKVMEKMLNGVCLQLEFERALVTQPECFSELMASLFSPTDECSLSYPKYSMVYTLEPIPIVYSDEECSDFISASDCRIRTRRNCDANLKAIVKYRFDMAFELIYCDASSTSRFPQNNILRFLQ